MKKGKFGLGFGKNQGGSTFNETRWKTEELPEVWQIQGESILDRLGENMIKR